MMILFLLFSLSVAGFTRQLMQDVQNAKLIAAQR